MTFRINSLGKVFCRPDWVWDMRARRFVDYDLWFVVEGRGRVELEGRGAVPVNGGDCYLFRPGMTLRADNEADAPLTVVYTHFDVLGPEAWATPGLYRKLSDPFFFSELLRRMLGCHYQKRWDEAAGWLGAALLELAGEVAGAEAFGKLDEYIRTLRATINEHPERVYCLGKLAAKAGCCPAHFSRLFKAGTGTAFRDCVALARVERAKLLLESTGYPLARVAALCGFPDVYQFSKQFKARAGVPPSYHRLGVRPPQGG